MYDVYMYRKYLLSKITFSKKKIGDKVGCGAFHYELKKRKYYSASGSVWPFAELV